MKISTVFRLLMPSILTLWLSGCGSGASSDSSTTIPTSTTSTNNTSGLANMDLAVSLLTSPEAVTHLGYALFEFEAKDAAQYECQLDTAEFEVCRSPFFLEWVLNGDHYLTIRGQNRDANFGESLVFRWTVEDVFLTAHQDLLAANVVPSAVAPNSWRGIFRINCDFSHSSYNDPIVFPSQENAAHLHRFYGNTLVDHNTTLASLYMTGESSCQGNQLNLSAYWVPALLAPDYDQVTGDRNRDANDDPAWKAVEAVVGKDADPHEVFYYSAGVDDLQSIQPIPPGLRMIAGDHMGQPGSEQSTSIVRWHCQSWGSDEASNPRWSTGIPECGARGVADRVRMDIFFPSCWNGVDLDSSDHKRHMAYPIVVGRVTQCPESHPVPVVRPSYHYAFGVKPEVFDSVTQASTGWRLASDMYDLNAGLGGMSLHGDWFNGWHPDVMDAILKYCIQGELDCHDGNLANGYRLSDTREGTQFEPDVINQGLGD
jgi:hypothetical protein